MSMLINMMKNKDNLSAAEKSVLDYLIENKDNLKNFGVEKIAKGAYTSPASVVRMCKKMGYKGFKDFKIDFILAHANVDVTEENARQDIILTRSNKDGKTAIRNNISILEETLTLFSEEEVEKAANLIMNARKVIIYGKGSSYLVSKDLEMKLTRINKLAFAQCEFDEHLIDSTFLNSKDVMVLISNSGKTKEVVSSALIAKENKATVISITKIGPSMLADLSDVVLYTASLEGEFRSAAMSSRISQLAMVDALYTHCAYKDIDRSIKMLKKTHETFKKFKK